jgi:hypothetical protein
MNIQAEGEAFLKAVIPLVANLGLVHRRIHFFSLVLMELGAAIKVASTIGPSLMGMPRAMR